MIRVTGLFKQYGNVAALTDVSLEIDRGECIALTGSHGSGRTTFLRILATLSAPSAGTVEIDGNAHHDLRRVRRRIAYVGQELPTYQPCASGLSTEEYLHFVHTARNGAQADAFAVVRAALGRSGLAAATPVEALSPGMWQRLSLTAALVSGADLLLLDDPLRLLDPPAHGVFTAWLEERRDHGCTIVAALDDERAAAVVSDRCIRFDAGRVSNAAPVAGTAA